FKPFFFINCLSHVQHLPYYIFTPLSFNHFLTIFKCSSDPFCFFNRSACFFIVFITVSLLPPCFFNFISHSSNNIFNSPAFKSSISFLPFNTSSIMLHSPCYLYFHSFISSSSNSFSVKGLSYATKPHLPLSSTNLTIPLG